ncbi:proline dehydrogenase [Acidobacteria bacterium Mor1]|nr:proline dehydrogenase [Acidobacteria bacterium Mor1]
MNLFDRAVSLTIPLMPKPVVRYFSRKYIAGETSDEAFAVIRDLRAEGALVTLDILGEFIKTREEAERNTRDYQELLRKIVEHDLSETNVSVKLSALGLLLKDRVCLDNMRALMTTASEVDRFVRIDMEDSPCTTATLDIYRTLRSEFGPRVGVVLQSRLRRTLDDIDALTAEPSNFRLCKGIYLEPRSIAYTDPEIIRRNFTLSLERMIKQGAYVGIATHDEILVWDALELIDRHGLNREQYEFQMLLGVDEPLRRILIEAGHRLRVYVPYGEQWYAYSVRRLKENPQIAGYALKAIFKKD